MHKHDKYILHTDGVETIYMIARSTPYLLDHN